MDRADSYPRSLHSQWRLAPSPALVASLRDPYAELLTKESYRQYQRQMSGTEVDVGLTPGNGIGSARSAFAPGDVILSIDGKSTAGWSARRLRIRRALLRKGTRRCC